MIANLNLAKLKKKYLNKSVTVGVLGLGYVGLPLAFMFAKKSIKVIGFDIDKEKIIKLKKKQNYFKYSHGNIAKEIIETGFFSPTTDFRLIKKCDALIICVPTPINKNKVPDLTAVKNTSKVIAKFLKKGHLISLESSTYPSTTGVEIKSILENKLKVNKDFFLIYSPEREDPGNKTYDISSIPKVLGAESKFASDLGNILYGYITKKIINVQNTQTAEAVKLLENIFRSVNIALVNELKTILTKMGIDIFEVVKAASSKPFGYMPFYPGPGIGGHCIPVDPFYLTHKAKEYGLRTRFIELAGEINSKMPEYVVQNLISIINKKTTKNIKKIKVCVLGLSYKKNIDDLRESPSLEILEILKKEMIKFDVVDPFFKSIPRTREHENLYNTKILNHKKINYKKYDATLLLTDHDIFDYKKIHKESKLIIDTRGKFEGLKSNKIFIS
jgi:UDP-N-acetyl-D-glucosamine dehydrogenase